LPARWISFEHERNAFDRLVRINAEHANLATTTFVTMGAEQMSP
jgi:hypothetical protein